ncbi:MAG TPA: hypothetical protein VHB98_21600 [Chloroflexota bacterium]|jgi:hypothetical protein|nr:hypothetical protein [Chloroflexota bacterium]
MNIAVTASTRGSSRFLEHLRTLVGTGGAGRVGFRAQAAAPRRHVGLVAAFQDVDVAAMRRAVQAGADALEVAVSDASALRALIEALGKLEAPVGIAVAAEAGDDLARTATEGGIDWIRLALDASLSSLAWERPARFLALPYDIDLRVTGALNGPFADAVVVTAPDDEPWTFQIAQGLRLRTFSEVIKKPLLLQEQADAPRLSAAVYEALGVAAVIVPADGPAAADRIAGYLGRLHHAAPDKA